MCLFAGSKLLQMKTIKEIYLRHWKLLLPNSHKSIEQVNDSVNLHILARQGVTLEKMIPI